jgi:hypothetical protein
MTQETKKLQASEDAYSAYIDEHINNVKLIWRHIGNNQSLRLDDAHWCMIDKLIDVHDASKYEYDEFRGYRVNFYPTEKEKTNKEYNKSIFDFSWNHHQKTNRHHWQYWILIEGVDNFKTLPMPFMYIVEMLCDWSAMSLKFKDSPSAFYNKNKDRMILHDDTRRCVESNLAIFDDAVSQIMKG